MMFFSFTLEYFFSKVTMYSYFYFPLRYYKKQRLHLCMCKLNE